MKKLVVAITICACLLVSTATATSLLDGYEYVDGVWMKNPVLTDHGYMPECAIVKITHRNPDGTYHQPDPCTEDPWGNDYAPWGGSGGGGDGDGSGE